MRGALSFVLALTTWLSAAPLLAQDVPAATTPASDAIAAPPEATPPPSEAPAAETAEAAVATSTPEATEAPAAPARVPKVAIVIAGDPDPSALAAASSLQQVLAADGRVTMPSDPAMREALVGQGQGDGLDDVRAERRHLGLGEAREIGSLAVLGEVASADLVLVVRSAHGSVTATAFDVLRRAFYDGDVTLEPLDVEETTRFVVRRATRSTRPLAPGERATAEATPAPSVDPATAVPPEAIAGDPEHPEHEPDFFEQYWPYFAAGALLIGAVVFIVFATQSNSTPPPVLRFEAGGGS